MESSTSLTRLLDRLEAAKRQFGPGGQIDTARLLVSLERPAFFGNPTGRELLMHKLLEISQSHPSVSVDTTSGYLIRQ